MLDGIRTFAFIVAVVAALVSGFDAFFNDGDWVRLALNQLNVPDFPDLFASL